MSNIYGSTFLAIIKNIAIPNKYTTWYCDIIERSCKRYIIDHNVTITQNRRRALKLFGYMEGHHIVPSSLSPEMQNDHDNIVFLTAREHFIVHLLLTKMLRGVNKHKMEFAFRRMQHCQQGQRYMSRIIAYLKPNLPPANKNKVSINNGLETRYHNKELPIPEGWSLGTGSKLKKYRQNLNNEVHRRSYLVERLDGNKEIVVDLKEWSEKIGIPYTTLTSAAQHNSLVRNQFRIQKLGRIAT